MMLASTEQLLARLGVAELSPLELGRAEAALEDASALVAGELRVLPSPVPAAVATVVLRAAERGFRNPSGSTSHTAGIYSESFATSSASGVYLTDQELEILRPWRRTSGLLSVRMQRPELDWPEFRVPTRYTDGRAGEDMPWFDPAEY